MSTYRCENFPRVAVLALLVGVGCFVAASLMPSGFEACVERHSAATCHHALYR